ncbi:hypothetical protein RHSIM_Rhsim01G0158300 [Rhododendron simsii]|uniref:HAT C-terminal dimerisation domain-containing protein n=1 Tax=Rhododendron simsii TaxID=118357 RepID=A0A834HJC6_RHOSS|nr:hypothetical protein RHSIM_Rhsim01G0158300 [Rhododendron simsii]
MHMQKETNMANKSELEKYLAEAIEDDSDKFDVLCWWKLNSSKYLIVSLMARDVQAIPVSMVASESAFSTSGRVIEPYRSSLSLKTMEALICTQQWIRKPTKINIKEQLDELEELDSGKVAVIHHLPLAPSGISSIFSIKLAWRKDYTWATNQASHYGVTVIRLINLQWSNEE